MEARRHFWGDVHGAVSYAPLEGAAETDTLVVGGGITGLFVAYHLLANGVKDVMVIERDTIGSGSTGHSGGMLVCEPETASWKELVAKHGPAHARAYWDAQAETAKVVAQIIVENDIDCDYMDQELLFLAANPSARKFVLSDFAARKAMASPADLLAGKELKEEILSDRFSIGERVPGNISLNPLKFVRGMSRTLAARGVRIHERTAFVSAGEGCAVTSGGEVRYRRIVRCMGVADRESAIDRYLTTIAITRKLSEEELECIGLADRDMFIDDEKRSYHYGKITGEGNLLVGYGDVLRKGEEPCTVHQPHLRSIERFLTQAFPDIDLPLIDAWSSEYALAKGDLPIVAVEGEVATVNGAGTQLTSILVASYAVAKLLGKEHSLAQLFEEGK